MTPSRTKIAWITGAHGLIGNELVQSASRFSNGLATRGLARDTVDLLDHRAVTDLFHRERPALVIHCAAISRSPVCDADPKLAHRTNVELTGQLAELASEIPFVFFSTDLIFDGTKGAYVEEDPPNPLSVYGETKALAEELVRRHPQHLIVRLSLTGGISLARNRAFNEEMKNAWRAGKALNLFTDEYRCPSAAPFIARAVWDLILKGARGTFHVCFSERMSRYDLGLALAAKHPELTPKIIATSRRDYQGPPRPPDTCMLNTRAQQLLSFPLPGFSEWLRNDTSGF
jgi:dTDP-4-dehydrorhamnose reductase